MTACGDLLCRRPRVVFSCFKRRLIDYYCVTLSHDEQSRKRGLWIGNVRWNWTINHTHSQQSWHLLRILYILCPFGTHLNRRIQGRWQICQSEYLKIITGHYILVTAWKITFYQTVFTKNRTLWNWQARTNLRDTCLKSINWRAQASLSVNKETTDKIHRTSVFRSYVHKTWGTNIGSWIVGSRHAIIKYWSFVANRKPITHAGGGVGLFKLQKQSHYVHHKRRLVWIGLCSSEHQNIRPKRAENRAFRTMHGS